jgi:hypothetical protein
VFAIGVLIYCWWSDGSESSYDPCDNGGCYAECP